ncbi:hypothetical protein EP7_000126 [Isosphaeraceae bacterium EP7]
MRRTQTLSRRTTKPETARRRARSIAAAIRAAVAGAWPLVALAGFAAMSPSSSFAQAPGPETFAVQPQTPIELWGAVDYLVRTEQAPAALPYLRQFLASEPSDATWLDIRDRFGEASILRLQDAPETRAQAPKLLGRLADAERRAVTAPGRLEAAIDSLEKSPEERAFAQQRLREAGPYAVPLLAQALAKDGLGDETRQVLKDALNALDDRAVPPMAAAALAAGPQAEALADAIGKIRDARALAALVALESNPKADPAARQAARTAIVRITGVAFDARPQAAKNLLVGQSRNYRLGRIRFPGERVTYWTADGTEIKPVTAPRREAERHFATAFALAARAIAPDDADVRSLSTAIAIEDEVERSGLAAFPGEAPSDDLKLALASGPANLSRVLDEAIADREYPLAAATAGALGKAIKGEVLAGPGGKSGPAEVTPTAQAIDRAAVARTLAGSGSRPHALVRALSAPDPRVRFAAARALVDLSPSAPFLGSGKVVPTLAYFAGSRPERHAVVIDGNIARGGQLGGMLESIGYSPLMAITGAEGFRLAASSSSVELVFIDPSLVQGAWRLNDTLTNLRADARTANLPAFVVGPLGMSDEVEHALDGFRDAQFLVTPASPTILRHLLDRPVAGLTPAPLTTADRVAYAAESAAMLARLGEGQSGPFRADLPQAIPALVRGLNAYEIAVPAAKALAFLPTVEAQRSLAEALLDPARSPERRAGLAEALATSLGRYGNLLAPDQGARLDQLRAEAAGSPLGDALRQVVESMKARQLADGRGQGSAKKPARP